MTPPMHVTFSSSAAGSLKMALKALGRTDEVDFLCDNLGIGPINPPEPRLRDEWMQEMLGNDAEPDVVAQDQKFWQEVTSQTEIVAWISRRYVTEYCGFLELISSADSRVSVVDVADVEFTGRDGRPRPLTSQAFGYVGEKEIVSLRLIERAVQVTPQARDEYRAEWQKLRSENGALRVLTADGMISAPINYYDELILSFITDQWQTCGRIVGSSLERTSEGSYRQACDDVFLFSRLLMMLDEAVIEGKNEHELWSLRESWVRRPT